MRFFDDLSAAGLVTGECVLLRNTLGLWLLIGMAIAATCMAARAEEPAQNLFAADGLPTGWLVTDWSDLRKAPPEGAQWRVEDGILRGSTPRGTWLVSEAEYGDFQLEFEWRLGERGNSGLALRAPLYGDPAFDGLELQMVDPRYYPAGQAPQQNELTGSFYRAVAPTKQVFRPTQWNHYQVTCRGPNVKVVLNGETIQDLNLDKETLRPQRHDGSEAPALRDRPRRGHIGFQELSRGGGQVEIRHVQIKAMKPE